MQASAVAYICVYQFSQVHWDVKACCTALSSFVLLLDFECMVTRADEALQSVQLSLCFRCA